MQSLSTQMNTVFFYKGSEITFQNGANVMVNATEMAKPFSKSPKDFLKTDQTRYYINTLSEVKKILSSDLVKVIYGDNGGTWLHEDVALEFARWLSPHFAIWCNDRIKELLTTGVSTINNDDEMIAHAIAILQKRLANQNQRVQILEGQTQAQIEEIKSLAPKAEYTDTVLQSNSTFTTTQIAQGLDMSANALNAKLKDLGIQYRQSGQWTLTAKAKGKGYAKNRIHSYFNQRTETVETSQTLVWTEKGRQFIHSLNIK